MLKNIFITGASGLVGSIMVDEWLKNKSYDQIICVTRNPQRVPSHKKIRAVKGDVTKPQLGLSLKIYTELATHVTAIFHSAANTSFTQSKPDALRVNLLGTKHMSTFALACKHLDRFGFVSTAYTAGKRTGTIAENELVHHEGFVNNYEYSKYLCEDYLRKLTGQLPIAVYRLSTIAGSNTGRVRQFNAIHQALKLCYHGLAPFIPAHPAATVDFISEEYLRRSLWYLFTQNFVPGKTFHIVTGIRNTFTITQLLDETYHAFEQHSAAWKKKRIEKPVTTDWKTFSLFADSVSDLKNPILSDILNSMSSFAPQLLYPKLFDEKNAETQLPVTIRPEPIQSYYKKIVQYCINSKWKKNYSKKN